MSVVGGAQPRLPGNTASGPQEGTFILKPTQGSHYSREKRKVLF